MGMDICERRQSDEKLRLLNRAIDSSINAIVIIDLAMAIQYVNDAFVKMTGYEKEEMLGKTCELFFGSTLEHDQLSLIRQSLHERREAHFSVRSYRKDRSLYWIDLYIGPVRNAEGNPTHFIGVLNDVSDTKQYEMQLERQANFDLLTHLPNRNLLYDRIRQGIARAHREGGNLAVAFVDLDNFKFINDSLGHNVGDQLLTNVADRMNSVLREGDTLARYGGDEFVYVLCSHQSEEAVAAWMSRLSKAMAPPFLVANQQIYVTFSVGVSFFPQDGQDVDTLLRNADMAMYRAKDAGKNNLQFFTSTMNTRVAGRLSLEGRLRRAIEREEFVLYYQPQLDLRTGRINGMEALIRWVPYDGDIVMPADFIPLAEETGLIVPIGRWVMHTACAQNKAFQEAGLPAISVSVNLSTRQFGPQSLVGLVNSALHRSSLPAACLELEVTESMVMNNPEDAKDILERLKEMGIRLAIDDFGTGYSSFSYLKRFPMDQLKIDQSFIKDIGTSADDAAIVQAIIALGHNLGLRVIAEGVCDERQMHFLRSHGCDEVQGYYCSPPLPFEEMASLLEKEKRNALQ
jgi:diguanylate cyclase (GGDEF)-like protein/PAS domain S-box-containing protein